MSVIRPFRGLRPRPEMAAEVAAPPYDVLSSAEAREQVRGHPDSFLHVNKPEVDCSPDTSPYSKDVYEKGRENLERLVEAGILRRDEADCLYLYRLTWQGRSQTGLVALASSREYDEDRIKKHEHTRPEKVADRTDHMEGLGAQVGPVFSIFRDDPEILGVFLEIQKSAPEVDFTVPDMDVRHEVWVVSEPGTIDRLVMAFGKLPALYIADGHHRSAAAAEYSRRMRERNPGAGAEEPWNYFLNVVFPSSQLRILPYNRVVKGLAGRTPEQFLEGLRGVVSVEPSPDPVEPARPLEFGLYLAGRWYRLLAGEDAAKGFGPAEAIDSALLTRLVLTPLLEIEDVRTDKRIDFVGGIRGVRELVRLVDSGEFDVAFSLYPVSVGQLLEVADAGEVMPPKSTWFEPKLRSGLVVNLLTE